MGRGLTPKRHFYGWTMLATLWGVMFLNLGFPAYGPSIINTAMAKAQGLNRETLGNLLSVYIIMSGLPGPLVAMSVNHFGVRKTLVLGSLFTISGSLLMATVVTGGLGGMLCYGLLVGTGVATGAAMAAQAGLARWFVRRRSLALSVLYSAGAIGGFVAAPLLNRLIETTGNWRSGWWLLAALSTLAACVALVFVRETVPARLLRWRVWLLQSTPRCRQSRRRWPVTCSTAASATPSISIFSRPGASAGQSFYFACAGRGP
jgi:MFS family permease